MTFLFAYTHQQLVTPDGVTSTYIAWLMPPKFQKSNQFLLPTDEIEEEVLNEYALFIDSFGAEDVLLKDVPIILAKLKVPPYFYSDVSDCIQWFYDTQAGGVSSRNARWTVVVQLLQHLTLSATSNGHFETSDVVDVDKLVKFCIRLLKFRDSCPQILNAWALFVEAAGYLTKDQDIAKLRLSLHNLKKIKSKLQLDDLSDSILIDMLGCSKTTVSGEIYNYRSGKADILVDIKDFAEIMGQLGLLD